MRVLHGVRSALGTLVVGALLGYVVTSFAMPFLQDSPLFGGTGESREARAYMLAILQQDPDLLGQVTQSRGVVQQAMRLQGPTNPQAAMMTPVSLTYIGGRTIGPYQLQAYAVELRPSRGAERFFPLVLTLVDGKVVGTQ